jgi:hypothetical protein
MDPLLSAGAFVGEWAQFLEEHGHSVREVPGAPWVLVSRNGRTKRYRWILLGVEGESLVLGTANKREIRRQVRLARNANERVYIVAKFEEPVAKVVVMPASEALKAKRLSPDRGGIPWRY